MSTCVVCGQLIEPGLVVETDIGPVHSGVCKQYADEKMNEGLLKEDIEQQTELLL